MLTRRQKVAVLGVAGAAILLILLLGRKEAAPVPRVSMVPIRAQFDGPSAIEFTRVLSEGYPDRVTGSAGALRAANYLRSEFERLGYQVEILPFAMWLRGDRVRGENVAAIRAGERPETVAVVAHYDGQTTSHQAAEDNASGVGVLLELARGLGARPHQRGLIFVATDAEEWGMIGARELAGFFRSHLTLAVISIDYLNQGRAPALGIDCSGQFAGYTPLWFRQLMEEAGEVQGTKVEGPAAAWEWVERAVEVSAQDQGPLLRAGIPAVNVSTLTKDSDRARARYHSTEDVFQGFDPGSFWALGATVEQAVRTLDTIPLARAPGMDDLRTSRDRYLPGGTVRLLQILGLAPILLAGALSVRNLLGQRVVGLARHFLRPLVYMIPPLFALLALYALTWTNVLKRFELYPATPKDPFLVQLPWQVLLPVALTLVLGYWVVRAVRLRLPPARPRFEVTQGILGLWLCLVVAGAFHLNPYAMWLYLGAFTYAWVLIVPPQGIFSRAFNAVLLLAASLPFAALLYFYGREIFLGWRILWYLALQAAYGVWSPSAIILFLAAGVLWIQFLRISVFQSHATDFPPAGEAAS